MQIQILALAAALGAATVLAQPLSLDEALRAAEARSPQLASQRAAAEAAAALVAAAGENPDPKLFFGVENVPVEGGDKWSLTADGMTMRRVGVMQDFVRGEKRDSREARAAAEARREAAMLEMQRADLRRDVATAWFERYYAERSRALVQGLIDEAGLQEQAATAALAAGRMGSSEPVAARLLRVTLADRLADLDRQVRRANTALARWLGPEAARALAPAPELAALHVHSLESDLEGHPHLAIYAPMEAAAEADLRLARAATQPDWSVELSYGQRGSAFTNMVSLMVRMELPVFASRRQEPAAASKERTVEQVRAQSEEGRRRHLAEIAASVADWEAARARVERYRRDIVPLAEERANATREAYAGARVDLAAVLEARRGALEARLAQLQGEAELARAWAQLAYLVPERKSP